MQVIVRSDLEKAIAKLDALGKGARFAVSLALNKTANQARKEIERQIPQKLDNPTAYTKQALWTKASNYRRDLTAEVKLKDVKRFGARFTHGETLGHLFVPAPTRNPSGLERMLYSTGRLKRGEYLLPSTGARLDGNGNMSRGQIKQIITQLKMSVSSYDNATSSKRSMRNRRKNGVIWWSDGTEGLKRGLFMRVGREIECIAAVIQTPRYAVRINMEKLVDGMVRSKFENNLDESITYVMNNAKK